MNIALTKHFEDMIVRLVASGHCNNSSVLAQRINACFESTLI